MPLARRKKVLITKDDESLQEADPDTPVYYIKQTGEIFKDYSSFSSRMSFYGLKIFQCETSGKGNLTFFEALESEKTEARVLDARFPEPLKAAVLRSVQWQVVGRLDHLVEAVYERFKDRYFEGERVFVDFGLSSAEDDSKETPGKGRYSVQIASVASPSKSVSTNGKRKASQMENGDDESIVPHDIYGDLKQPVAEVNALDDPKGYTYNVQLVEEGPNGTFSVVEPETHGDLRLGNTTMDVHCDLISRDRLAFSKSILKRFIRECVDRDAAVASPWIVKADIASKYNINQNMPEEVRRGVDAMKRLESDKRKKIIESKETTTVSPSKRPKRTKPAPTEEEKAAKVKEEEAAKAKRERDEVARQALTGCKRAVARWPIEDLDVSITEKEKSSGKPLVRPIPHRISEFPAPDSFEPLLMAWNFITTYGHAFNVSPFPLDMLEAALHHDTPEPCFLIDCLHTGIISSCRSVSAAITKNQVGVTSLVNEYNDEMETDDTVGLQQLVQSLTAFGSGWEKKAVNHETWCNALVSILKEHATVQTMPTMRPVLSHLLFQPGQDEANPESTTGWVSARPRERYYSLAFDLKISILAFLCDLSATGKAVHNAMETCETSITEMRKEKLELKKEQKRLADQLATLTAERRKAMNGAKKGKKKTVEVESTADATPPESVLSDHESDELVVAAVADLSMDTAPSEAASDELPGSSAMSDIIRTTPTRPGARSARASLRFKAHDQARLANEKKQKPKKQEVRSPTTKEDDDELRNCQDDLAKIDRDLEMLELDFRQYLLLARMRPMGLDRFHCKVWWFDGVGCMTLLDQNGDYLYGTGKLFIQGPSEDDLALIDTKAKADPSIGLRREVEEGEGILGVGEWAWYETPEEVESYLKWLNVKGQRESALEKALARWKPYLIGGMETRHKELTTQTKQPENRRRRKSNTTTEARAPYLHYVNLYSTKQNQ